MPHAHHKQGTLQADMRASIHCHKPHNTPHYSCRREQDCAIDKVPGRFRSVAAPVTHGWCVSRGPKREALTSDHAGRVRELVRVPPGGVATTDELGYMMASAERALAVRSAHHEVVLQLREVRIEQLLARLWAGRTGVSSQAGKTRHTMRGRTSQMISEPTSFAFSGRQRAQ